jgi:hypothetical protein
MPKNKVEVSISHEEFGLEALQSLAGANRLLGLKRALQKAGVIPQRRAKELCPKPGYPGDDPEKKPLVDTIGVKVWVGDYTIVCYVGPQYPAGAHGHLIEFGHRLVRNGQVLGWVNPKPFMRPAADETKSEQEAAIKSELQAAARRAERRAAKGKT